MVSIIKNINFGSERSKTTNFPPICVRTFFDIPTTAATGDVIPVASMPIHCVPSLYIRHFGNGGKDDTLVGSFTLAAMRLDDKIAVNSDGTVVLVTPNYFSTDLTFADERDQDFNIQRDNPRRAVITIKSALDESGLGHQLSTSTTVAVVFVVKTAATALTRISVTGTLVTG